nr:glycosyltransferase [Ardenticatena sp.]
MRVLYLSKALVVGAYQRKIEELAALGLEIHLAVPPAWRDERGVQPLELAHTRGYTLWQVPILFDGSYHLHMYLRLGDVLDAVRPDLLHIDEEPYNLATAHAAWLARRRGIPFLFFTWQNLLRHYPPPFAHMERFVYRHAACAIAGNRDAAHVLRRKGFAGDIDIIPQFGVDPALFSPPAERPPHPFTIGYAGRFVPEKGLLVLLDALASLPGEWRFIGRGSGPLLDTLQQRALELGMRDRVAWEPPLPSTRMADFYRELDVLVLPSLSRSNWVEQFGRVLIEAMACGVPPIGSDSGEIPHVIGDAGLVVPEGNAQALRDALHRLMTTPDLLAALRLRARERVLARFTQAQIARRTMQVYTRICGTPCKPH